MRHGRARCDVVSGAPGRETRLRAEDAERARRRSANLRVRIGEQRHELRRRLPCAMGGEGGDRGHADGVARACGDRGLRRGRSDRPGEEQDDEEPSHGLARRDSHGSGGQRRMPVERAPKGIGRCAGWMLHELSELLARPFPAETWLDVKQSIYHTKPPADAHPPGVLHVRCHDTSWLLPRRSERAPVARRYRSVRARHPETKHRPAPGARARHHVSGSRIPTKRGWSSNDVEVLYTS